MRQVPAALEPETTLEPNKCQKTRSSSFCGTVRSVIKGLTLMRPLRPFRQVRQNRLKHRRELIRQPLGKVQTGGPLKRPLFFFLIASACASATRSRKFHRLPGANLTNSPSRMAGPVRSACPFWCLLDLSNLMLINACPFWRLIIWCLLNN